GHRRRPRTRLRRPPASGRGHRLLRPARGQERTVRRRRSLGASPPTDRPQPGPGHDAHRQNLRRRRGRDHRLGQLPGRHRRRTRQSARARGLDRRELTGDELCDHPSAAAHRRIRARRGLHDGGPHGRRRPIEQRGQGTHVVLPRRNRSQSHEVRGQTMSNVIRDVPSDALTTSRIGDFLTWVNSNHGRDFTGWDELYDWSVTEIEDFWAAVWEYFEVKAHTPYSSVLEDRRMPGAKWFTGARLNYAEHSFGTDEQADDLAVTAVSQTRADFDLTFAQLRNEIARVRSGLKDLGVGEGDRVVGYLPNQPEALVAFLAAASLGAIWASCAPEFGTQSVIDRFSQIEPTVLLAIGGYMYGDKAIDRTAEVAEVVAALPTLSHVITVDYGDFTLSRIPTGQVEVIDYTEFGDTSAPLEFASVDFDHQLVVLFSSGTTGRPKSVVHSHGGILLETLQNRALRLDPGPDSRFRSVSTDARVMRNAPVGSRVSGYGIVMIEGNPNHPDKLEVWRIASQTKDTLMRVAPGAILAARKAGFSPTEEFDLSTVTQFGAAGAPLPAEGY